MCTIATDKGVMRYRSTKEPLINHEETERNKNYRSTHAARDVFMGWVAVDLRLEQGYAGELRLPKTGSRYLLNGCVCRDRWDTTTSIKLGSRTRILICWLQEHKGLHCGPVQENICSSTIRK